MKPQLINRTLEPPEKAGSEYEETERLIKLLEWVRATYKPEQIFELHEHDKEVAQNYHRFIKRYEITHLVDRIEGKPYPTEDELWEIYITENKPNKH